MSSLGELAIPTGDSNSCSLNNFLTHLSNALAPFPTYIIFDKKVAYTNEVMLNRDVKRQVDYQRKEFESRKEAAIERGMPLSNQDIEDFNTELQEFEEDLSNCGLISNAIRFYKASKCNYFLFASPTNICWIRSQAFRNLPAGDELLDALQKHRERRRDWHAFAVRIQDRKVCVLEFNLCILLTRKDIHL